MKITTKRYVITTSIVNNYLYRVLSNGVDFSQYLNNPILLWMHTRATDGSKNKILPMGRAVEIRLEGDKWTCYLDFDESDTFAMSIYQKYEAGILNMLSLGALPVEVSTDPALMLPGQIGPTVVRCKATEISCVDIGANDEAIPALYDDDGKIITLSFGNINNLIRLAKGNSQSTVAPPAVPAVKHRANTLAIVKNAVDAGKFDNKFAATLLSLGNDDNSVDTILKAVKNVKIDPDKLDGKIPRQLLPFVNNSYDEIDNSAKVPFKLKDFKEHAPEVYKAKFFEKNGRLPAEKDGKPL